MSVTVTVTPSCPKCQGAFPGVLCNTGSPVRCPVCEATVLLEIFPAAFQSTTTGATAETIVEEGVSSCFYHEGKKAIVHCDVCGRFLCALCDLDLGGRHLCPSCLQAGSKKGLAPQLEHSRTLYDSAALIFAFLSLIPGIHFFTAPAAVGMGIFSFFKPNSMVRRSRFRGILAIVLGAILGVLWTWLMFFRGD